jgi:hypothetical protein
MYGTTLMNESKGISWNKFHRCWCRSLGGRRYLWTDKQTKQETEEYKSLFEEQLKPIEHLNTSKTMGEISLPYTRESVPADLLVPICLKLTFNNTFKQRA